MKPPSNPISAEQLKQIIASLGPRYKKMMPLDPALERLAVVLTARQPQYDLPPAEQWAALGFPMHLVDVRGNKYTIEAPLFPPDQVPADWDERAFGHPRYAEPTTWRDLAKDIADEFHGTMGRTFDRRGATARFLEKVIPLITGETPSATDIGQWLMQPKNRKRPKERIR